MDLLSGLRKGDTSRGGRADFSWDDVKGDKDRENYLGHSLMAPVGRWQRNKDLTWYSKADSSKMSAEDERQEEIRRIKEAEQDALAAALGFPVQKQETDAVDQAEVDRAIKETGAVDQDKEEEGRGIGYGRGRVGRSLKDEGRERFATDGSARNVGDSYRPAQRRGGEKWPERRDGRDGRRDDKSRRHRSRSRDRGRDERDDDRRRERRHIHRSRSRGRRGEHRHRDERDRDSSRHRWRERSRSPHRNRDSRRR
jgi:hypothetical protein